MNLKTTKILVMNQRIMLFLKYSLLFLFLILFSIVIYLYHENNELKKRINSISSIDNCCNDYASSRKNNNVLYNDIIHLVKEYSSGNYFIPSHFFGLDMLSPSVKYFLLEKYNLVGFSSIRSYEYSTDSLHRIIIDTLITSFNTIILKDLDLNSVENIWDSCYKENNIDYMTYYHDGFNVHSDTLPIMKSHNVDVVKYVRNRLKELYDRIGEKNIASEVVYIDVSINGDVNGRLGRKTGTVKDSLLYVIISQINQDKNSIIPAYKNGKKVNYRIFTTL